MRWTSALAIYLLFWVLSAFVVLPFFARTSEEAGIDKVSGQADSAPAHFPVGRVALWVTIVGTTLFGIYYVVYTTGLLDPRALILERFGGRL